MLLLAWTGPLNGGDGLGFDIYLPQIGNDSLLLMVTMFEFRLSEGGLFRFSLGFANTERAGSMFYVS